MKTKKPIVSVIMAVRNQESYVSESIDSILNQTLQDFEMIVVDDSSNQKTQLILEKYAQKDKRIKVYRNHVRLGLTKSLNRAISFSRGHFIARQDGDDISRRDRLEKQYLFLRKNPSISMAGSYSIRWDITLNKKEFIRKPLGHDEIVTALHKPITPVTTIMVRTHHLKSLGGYNEKMYYGQDYELYLRASRRYKLANIPLYLSILRYHGKNNSIKYEPKMKAAVQWAYTGAVNRESFRQFYCRWRERQKNIKRLIWYFDQGRYHSVVNLFDTRIRKYRMLTNDVLYRVASAAKKIKKSKKAFNIFTKFFNRKYIESSYIGGAHFHVGELYVLCNKYTQARYHFKHCLAILPTHRKAKRYLQQLQHSNK